METKTEVAEKKECQPGCLHPICRGIREDRKIKIRLEIFDMLNTLKTDKTETFLTKFDDKIKYIEDRIVKL